MLLRRARTAILPAAAVAAAGVTIWVDTLRGINVDRDDLCPAVLTIILGVGAIVQLLLAHFYRRFWRESRAAKFEYAVGAIAEGIAAEMHGHLDGGGQRAPGPRGGR